MFVGPFNLIVPAGVLKNGSDVFTILDPDGGGAATFSVRLSANGLEPASHFGARTMLENTTVQALQDMTVPRFKAYVDELSVERGRTPMGSVTAFKNSLLMDASTSFWDFVAANGLQRVK